jgi:hypothetical protein
METCSPWPHNRSCYTNYFSALSQFQPHTRFFHPLTASTKRQETQAPTFGELREVSRGVKFVVSLGEVSRGVKLVVSLGATRLKRLFVELRHIIRPTELLVLWNIRVSSWSILPDRCAKPPGPFPSAESQPRDPTGAPPVVVGCTGHAENKKHTENILELSRPRHGLFYSWLSCVALPLGSWPSKHCLCGNLVYPSVPQELLEKGPSTMTSLPCFNASIFSGSLSCTIFRVDR